ncbi:MAG TPA: Fic family protein [Desulfobacteraceae bacterium]|nr:Fic family protein [Desulfobacteraceae bacterium]HPJ66150.1 Fic family protein [Desulfobacteraceae bacterium]HPQ27046.1 Fic family protein [Desulfobacteraceae bacterium]
MMTLRIFSHKFESVPAATSWYLSDLGESRGKQELFSRQSPQRLKSLREHALIESALSSNRIEGVEVDQSRIATIVLGNPLLRDRDEEEVRGYRQALTWIHEKGTGLALSEENILKLHHMTRGEIWDAGKYKEKDGDIIEKFPDGRSRIRFKTVSAKDTPVFIKELVELYDDAIKEHKVPLPVLLAAFNLDFLCIHPFRDGNGRVSRLLMLLQCYHLGFEVGRYISLERLIEQNKERYYETLEQSSKGWHEGKHDPWPYINYILSIIRMAYKEFEERLGRLQSPRGEKTYLVLRAIDKAPGPFHIAELRDQCPNVSLDMIRRVLKNLREKDRVECMGRGQSARWRKTMSWKLGNTQ